MNVTNIETLSRLAGPGSFALTIDVLINGVQKASWSQNVTTFYTNYTHSRDVSFHLSSGDTITYKISGGTFSTPGGAISGPNYIKLTGQSCELPSITTFTGTPESIKPGQDATLSWSITGANSANIDQGIGSVNPASGSISVSPDSSTTYTLTATNTCGTDSAAVTIQVNKPSMSGILNLLLLNNDNSYRLPVRLITIDGNPTDWVGIQPVFVDDENDEDPDANFEGTDIRSFYLARDSQYLYMMFMLYDGNPRTDSTTVYQFQANQSQVDSDTPGDYFVGAYTAPIPGNYFVWVNQRTVTGHINIANYPSSYMGLGNNCIEWQVPLSVMGDLNGKFIRIYTHVLDQDINGDLIYPVSDDQILERYISGAP